jgi:pilus assembly protein CpaB
VTVAFPLVIGLALLAVQAGRQWIDRQVAARVDALRSTTRDAPAPLRLRTVVVASEPLEFGSPITRGALREIQWPAADLPQGGFAHVDDLFKGDQTRVALSSIEPGEPILDSRISGPGRKASLAALIDPGMTAVTVRVDEVIGVAGFVAPGDRVDVLVTHRTGDAEPVADVVQQDLRVLAVDQTVDNPTAKPSVAHAVTLEASTAQAEKLALAQSIGNLTLVLRPLRSHAADGGRRVTMADLGPDQGPGSSGRTVTVTVTRDAVSRTYSVPVAP